MNNSNKRSPLLVAALSAVLVGAVNHSSEQERLDVELMAYRSTTQANTTMVLADRSSLEGFLDKTTRINKVKGEVEQWLAESSQAGVFDMGLWTLRIERLDVNANQVMVQKIDNISGRTITQRTVAAETTHNLFLAVCHEIDRVDTVVHDTPNSPDTTQ